MCRFGMHPCSTTSTKPSFDSTTARVFQLHTAMCVLLSVCGAHARSEQCVAMWAPGMHMTTRARAMHE